MQQPIPKRILESNPQLALKKINTLLIDGSNLLEVCFRADKRVNSEGREVGAIFQFFLQVKLLLRKGNFRYVYCFFDGVRSGNLRYNENREYKSGRDKEFDDDGLSDYMKAFNARIKSMEAYFKGQKNHKTESEKESFFWQRDIIIQMCDELFIRTIMCDITEADDLIGWYVANKKPEENIVICTNDRDLTQLIHKSELDPNKDDVIVYVQQLHDFVNTRNHTDKMGYYYENVVLKKILCGDTSDNIKGIKGFGEKTLFDNFPDFKKRKMTLEEIIEGAKKINEDRLKEKKKPLKWAENIVNRITDGCQGEHIYEINEKIIDLKHPLMTDEAKELVENFMYTPLNPENRSYSNLYKIANEVGIDEWKDETQFGNFFSDYNYIIEKEKKEE